jgi:hypothetical protein
MSEALQRTDGAHNNPWAAAVELLRNQRKLISAWVPPRWAERTGRPRDAIAEQTIEAVKMQLVQLNTDVAPVSVMLATLACLQIGLRPDGATGHAYLIPIKGRVVLCIGYKGYVALAARSGIKQIRAEVVFQDDRFDVASGDNLAACRGYLPGPHASPKSPKSTWRHGFAYGVWLDGSFTEPIILSGRELADRHDDAVARNPKSYARGNALPWARNQMVRRMLAGGSIALVSDDYGGAAPAVLGAQIDAAGEAGKLGEVAQATLMSAHSSGIEPTAITQAERLLRDVSDADREQAAARDVRPRTPAEQLERQRRQADEPPPMPPELDGWAEGEEP